MENVETTYGKLLGMCSVFEIYNIHNAYHLLTNTKFYKRYLSSKNNWNGIAKLYEKSVTILTSKFIPFWFFTFLRLRFPTHSLSFAFLLYITYLKAPCFAEICVCVSFLFQSESFSILLKTFPEYNYNKFKRQGK